MAEVALVSIAKSALQLFSSLAKDEFILLWNSTKELEKLEATIDTISSFLHDADRRKSDDRSVEECLLRLRNVMYDTDDLFDALVAKALRKKTIANNAFTKEVKLFFSKSNQLGFMYKVANQVKSLRESLDSIKSDMDGFSFIKQLPPPIDQSIMRFDRNKTHYFVQEENVIGRDEDKVRVIDMLLPRVSIETLSVVAVIGFGGLGKTTLAQLVYNDKRVEEGFEVRLWACINYFSNLEQVLIEIIASKEERPKNLSLVMLQSKLREIISGRKFLIVLDDVWDKSSTNWGQLETILRCGKIGSKVMVTTRSREVAKCLDALEPYCDLGVLSEENAWSLFLSKVFHLGEEHPSKLSNKLETLGKEIIRRCGYVPLAIITVGSLLRQREREEGVWSKFLENELKEVLSSNDDKSVRKVLMISYNDLPSNLKLCFSYCSLFPKDYAFDKDKLVGLWLSQGFIKPSNNNKQCLEELGEACFFQLVERCFFQEVKRYNRYSYKGYETIYDLYGLTVKMHDLLHDMAMDVAKSECIFVDKISATKEKGAINIRHVSIDYEISDSFNPSSDLVSNPNTVRSLLVLNRKNQLIQSSLSQLLEGFKMLRMLCLPNMKTDHISDSIGELTHLRYLHLSNSQELKCLPSTICNLHHLMVLVLKDCHRLEKLPTKIDKLVSLRQLYIKHCNRLNSLPLGFRHLTLLVNLDRFIVHRQNGGLRYLNEMDNLSRILTIQLPKEGWSDSIKDAKRSNMSKKLKLDGMTIEWIGNYTFHKKQYIADEAKSVMEALCPHDGIEYLRISRYGGDMLSSWVCMLKNIKELCLCECDVEYLDDGVRVDDICFPSLRILILQNMRYLKGWWRREIPSETNRPCLFVVSRVTIIRCKELKGRMPLMEGVEYMVLSEVDVKLVKELLINNNGKLKELNLNGVEGLASISEGLISHLTAIQKLEIDYCSDLKWVSSRGLTHLTSLKHLTLGSFRIADEDDSDEVEIEVGMPWKVLNRLEELNLHYIDIHFLEGYQFLTSLTKLVIYHWMPQTNEELEDVIFPSKPLKNLSTLVIYIKKPLMFKVRGQWLPSLRDLNIENCRELQLDSKVIFNTNLDVLWLVGVESLILVKEDNTLEQNISSLRILRIDYGGKWVHEIPWKFFRSLKTLTLRSCGQWERIPEGIQHLTALQHLQIDGCDKVRSLPEWFAQLSSLTSLEMHECSEELKMRCRKESGEDFHLISHILITDIRTRSIDNFEEEESNEGGWSCLQRWKFSKGKKKMTQKSKKQESQPHASLNQIPQLTNELTSVPPRNNSEPRAEPDYSEPISKPASTTNPEPVAKSDVISRPPPMNVIGEEGRSFIALEYVSGFDTGDIHFSVDDVAELVNQWNLSLVGTPMGSNISYQAMQQFVSTHWTTGTPKIQLHENGIFVFQFEKEEHLLSILQQCPWMIEDQIPLILRRWHSGMPLDMSCFEQIPVWVTLPNLDVRFWSRHMLSRVGSAIGHPILTDCSPANQERIRFPRLLVQVSAKRQLLDQVRFLGADGEVISQRLQYEWLPPRCPKCCIFGHRCIDSVTEIQPASP